MGRAGWSVAADLSVLGEQIGQIRYDPQRPVAEQQEADVEFEGSLQPLRPSQWSGGWIG